MCHQITLEELGMIPPVPESHQKVTSATAIPCYDCICNHCTNSTECGDIDTGEADKACYTCENCKYFDGNGKSMWQAECAEYKITNQYAAKRRNQFKIVKNKQKDMRISRKKPIVFSKN